MNIYILCSVLCVLNIYPILSQEPAQPESNFYSIQSNFIKKFTKQKYKYYEQALKAESLAKMKKKVLMPSFFFSLNVGNIFGKIELIH